MKKINKKSINYGLKILAILAFALIFMPFNKASAAYGTNITYCGTNNCESYSDYNYNNNYYNPYQSALYQPPVYTPPPAPAVTPIVYSNSVNPNIVSTTIAPKTAKAKTTGTAKTVATTNPNSVSNLASNVIFGSNSFLPSGLMQWILFAIFILLLVILTRRIFGAREKYLAIPMKHD